MIAVHKNQIIKIHPGFATIRVADKQLNFIRQSAFLEGNLKEFIVLWRDVNRGHHGIVIAGDGKQERRATMITTDLQYLSSRLRPH